jgi:hypothetical protein
MNAILRSVSPARVDDPGERERLVMAVAVAIGVYRRTPPDRDEAERLLARVFRDRPDGKQIDVSALIG